MTATSQQQIKVVNLADSHILVLDSATNLFNWFQGAVAGTKAEGDFDEALASLDAAIAADGFLTKRLIDEWSLFTRSLRTAYGNFGRDVVHRFGVDEPAQVRNLALNIAKSSFERIRSVSREVLVTRIEATAAAGNSEDSAQA